MLNNIYNSTKKLHNIYKKILKERNIKIKKNFFFNKKAEFFNKKKIKNIRSKIYNHINYKIIYRPKDCSNINNENYNNLLSIKSGSDWLNFKKLEDKDLKKGINTWRKKSPYVIVADPIKICPEIKKISENKTINMYLKSYFNNMEYKLTFAKIIYSFKNCILPIDTQLFHSDFDGVKLIKVFIYLDEVKSLANGPTQFIDKTNIFKIKNKNILKQWPLRTDENNMSKFFKSKKIISFFGNESDVLLLNTGMMHRGKKPLEKDRMILILSYSIHNEINSTATFNIN